MRPSIWKSGAQLLLAWRLTLAGRCAGQSGKFLPGIKIDRSLFVVLVTAGLAVLTAQARTQPLPYSEDLSDGVENTITIETLDLAYIPPTHATKLKTFTFDAFGPYAFVSGAFLGGIDQATNAPPEWRQGFGGYSERFGSNFGITAAETTTRYLLADALKQDTLYYRCECSGLFPRLRHAVLSTLTGRSERDGRRVFSIPALVAPYAGSLIAVYGWYPRRYGAKDAFRMGNYSLLESVGSNIALEFLYSGPHSLLSRLHLNNSHGSPDRGPN